MGCSSKSRENALSTNHSRFGFSAAKTFAQAQHKAQQQHLVDARKSAVRYLSLPRESDDLRTSVFDGNGNPRVARNPARKGCSGCGLRFHCCYWLRFRCCCCWFRSHYCCWLRFHGCCWFRFHSYCRCYRRRRICCHRLDAGNRRRCALCVRAQTIVKILSPGMQLRSLKLAGDRAGVRETLLTRKTQQTALRG